MINLIITYEISWDERLNFKTAEYSHERVFLHPDMSNRFLEPGSYKEQKKIWAHLKNLQV